MRLRSWPNQLCALAAFFGVQNILKSDLLLRPTVRQNGIARDVVIEVFDAPALHIKETAWSRKRTRPEKRLKLP